MGGSNPPQRRAVASSTGSHQAARHTARTASARTRTATESAQGRDRADLCAFQTGGYGKPAAGEDCGAGADATSHPRGTMQRPRNAAAAVRNHTSIHSGPAAVLNPPGIHEPRRPVRPERIIVFHDSPDALDRNDDCWLRLRGEPLFPGHGVLVVIRTYGTCEPSITALTPYCHPLSPALRATSRDHCRRQRCGRFSPFLPFSWPSQPPCPISQARPFP